MYNWKNWISKKPEMFNKIAENFPDIQFTWIGEGKLKDKLIRHIIFINSRNVM